MLRRDFIYNASLMAAMPIISSSYSGPFLAETSETFKIKIGEINCIIFRDLLFKYQAKDYFINAESNELEKSLKNYKVTPDNIPSPFIATLVESMGKKILIDTGIGYSDKPLEFRGKTHLLKGRLQELLRLNGIGKEDISDLIITHFHPDHIGGIFGDDGKLNFPNAKVHIHQNEWNYWHSSGSEGQPPLFKYFVEQKISPLEKLNVNFFHGDFVEIVPGVTAVEANGHTPGQVAIHLQSGSKQMLYISDAFLHPLHIEKLDWRTNYDFDHASARKTREKLLHLAYKDKMIVNAFHFDFPGLGVIEKFRGAWKWNNGAV